MRNDNEILPQVVTYMKSISRVEDKQRGSYLDYLSLLYSLHYPATTAYYTTERYTPNRWKLIVKHSCRMDPSAMRMGDPLYRSLHPS
jgi:hypothetical protein